MSQNVESSSLAALPAPTAEDELKRFRSRAKSALEPVLIELVSDETRKGQRLLLSLSFVLLLLGLGAVKVSTVSALGLSIAIDQPSLIMSIVAVCLYFEVLVAIRCFTDWRLYRVRTGVADLDLLTLANEVETTSQSLADEISELARPLDETLEANRLRAIAGFGSERHQERSEKTARESERVRRATKSLETLRGRRAAVRAFVARSDWLRAQLLAIRTSRTLRVLWEMVFPLAFGMLGLLFGASAWLRRT